MQALAAERLRDQVDSLLQNISKIQLSSKQTAIIDIGVLLYHTNLLRQRANLSSYEIIVPLDGKFKYDSIYNGIHIISSGECIRCT
jgi:hypothetical protein